MVCRQELIERRYAIAMTAVAILEVYEICTTGSGAEKRRGKAPAAEIIIQSFPAEWAVEHPMAVRHTRTEARAEQQLMLQALQSKSQCFRLCISAYLTVPVFIKIQLLSVDV